MAEVADDGVSDVGLELAEVVAAAVEVREVDVVVVGGAEGSGGPGMGEGGEGEGVADVAHAGEDQVVEAEGSAAGAGGGRGVGDVAELKGPGVVPDAAGAGLGESGLAEQGGGGVAGADKRADEQGGLVEAEVRGFAWGADAAGPIVGDELETCGGPARPDADGDRVRRCDVGKDGRNAADRGGAGHESGPESGADCDARQGDEGGRVAGDVCERRGVSEAAADKLAQQPRRGLPCGRGGG